MKFSLKKLAVLTLCLGLFVTSCETEKVNSSAIETTGEPTAQNGEIIEITVKGNLIKAIKDNGLYITQGDIIVTPDSESKKGVGVNDGLNDGTSFWPGNTVFYSIDNSVASRGNDKVRIEAAMKTINTETGGNIKFVERKNAGDLIITDNVNSTASSSAVGKVDSNQIIKFGAGMTSRTILHELCHTLGMEHEHVRRDRDKFIELYPNNMAPGVYDANFGSTNGVSNLSDYGLFDFSSIMLYSSYQGNKVSPAGLTTMLRKVGTQRVIFDAPQVLSADDKAHLKSMYPVGLIVNDVAGNWAFKEIEYMLKNTSIKGSNGKFRPNDNLTRAEFASMIYDAILTGRTDSANNPSSFSDIGTHWAKDKIIAVAKAGYMKGAGGLFKPNDAITKLEVTLAISNKLADKTLNAGDLSSYYSDSGNLSTGFAWAVNDIKIATANRFIANYPHRPFFGFGTSAQTATKSTRAYAIFVIYQALDRNFGAAEIQNAYKITGTR